MDIVIYGVDHLAQLLILSDRQRGGGQGRGRLNLPKIKTTFKLLTSSFLFYCTVTKSVSFTYQEYCRLGWYFQKDQPIASIPDRSCLAFAKRLSCLISGQPLASIPGRDCLVFAEVVLAPLGQPLASILGWDCLVFAEVVPAPLGQPLASIPV
jgi:hypothetical protein